jgi:hypothetical protein
MPIRDIIIVNSSDNESATEEQEFEWEPTKNRSTEVDGRVDQFDMPDALPSFRCPIDHCVMRDPVVLSDGHSYDIPNIVRWLATNFTSPMTGRILVDRKLSPNINLQKAIREWLETRAEKEREDAARHEREAEEAARVEEEKARQLSMTRAREAEYAARVASIEAEAAARVESLRVMVARVEAQMAGRVREAGRRPELQQRGYERQRRWQELQEGWKKRRQQGLSHFQSWLQE